MGVRSRGQEDPLEEEMAHTPVFLPGESQGQRAWRAIAHGVTKSQTRLSSHSCNRTPLEGITRPQVEQKLLRGSSSSLLRKLCLSPWVGRSQKQDAREEGPWTEVNSEGTVQSRCSQEAHLPGTQVRTDIAPKQHSRLPPLTQMPISLRVPELKPQSGPQFSFIIYIHFFLLEIKMGIFYSLTFIKINIIHSWR